MKIENLKTFKKFVETEILPAATELENLDDKSRRHLQKLAFTNLVDRFDSMIDGTILENCREEFLVSEASKNLTQQVTEAELLKLLLHASNLQNALEIKIKDGLRNSVLRQRHSKKLKVLFDVLKPEEKCWNTPRVNIATGDIFEHITPQLKTKIPYSICGYADWIYARRNSIVHGVGKATLLDNDSKQLSKLFNCKPSKFVKIKPSSIKNAVCFYNKVIELLSA